MLGGGEDSSLGPFARLRPGITGEAQKRWRAHYGQGALAAVLERELRLWE